MALLFPSGGGKAPFLKQAERNTARDAKNPSSPNVPKASKSRKVFTDGALPPDTPFSWLGCRVGGRRTEVDDLGTEAQRCYCGGGGGVSTLWSGPVLDWQLMPSRAKHIPAPPPTPTPPNPLVNACILQEEAETERLQMQATRSGDDSTTPTRITTTCKHGLTENCTLYKACNIVSPIFATARQRGDRLGGFFKAVPFKYRLHTSETGGRGRDKATLFYSFCKKRNMKQ